MSAMPLRFYRVCGKNEVAIIVGTRALDRTFAATNPEFYEVVSDDRVAELMGLDEPVRAPSIRAYDGRICFESGRQRARAALLQGRRTISVIVQAGPFPSSYRRTTSPSCANCWCGSHAELRGSPLRRSFDERRGRQLDCVPPCCHDTNPRSGKLKRGIRKHASSSADAGFTESVV
jgi:hypothetical protein